METRNHATKASIIFNNGIVTFSNNGDIAGIEIDYQCSGDINIIAPDGWLYSSSENKIIMVSIDGGGNIEDGQTIIEYTETIEIKRAVIALWNNKSFTITRKFITDDSEYKKGAIYTTTDQINNLGGKNTIESNPKKISETIDSTESINISLKTKNTSNLKEIEDKYKEELNYNIDGVVNRRRVAKNKKSTKNVKMFDSAADATTQKTTKKDVSIQTGGSQGTGGGGY